MKKRPLNPNARKALDEMKKDIMNEYGLDFNKNIDKGNLTSRTNGNTGGNLGGTMTKRLIEMAEKELLNKNYNEKL